MSDPSKGFVTKLSPSSAPWLFGQLLQKITTFLAMKIRGTDKAHPSTHRDQPLLSPFNLGMLLFSISVSLAHPQP